MHQKFVLVFVQYPEAIILDVKNLHDVQWLALSLAKHSHFQQVDVDTPQPKSDGKVSCPPSRKLVSSATAPALVDLVILDGHTP